MTEVSRRYFISASSLFLVSCVTKSVFVTDSTNTLKLYQPFEDYDLHAEFKYGILVLDVKNNQHAVIRTPFNVHLVEVSKADPSLGLAVNKYGDKFLQLNLQKNEIVAVHRTDPGIVLAGHMCFSEDQTFLCATATDKNKNGQGCIVVLNPKNFQTEDIIHLSKNSPSHHDCKFINDSHLLATTAGHSIDVINLKTKAIEQNIFKFKDPASQIRHFSVNTNGAFCAQANAIDTSTNNWLYSRAEILTMVGGEKNTIDLSSTDAAIANAELLDFAFNRRGDVFAAVHASTNKITFWNLESKKILSLLHIEGAKRVAFDDLENRFIIVASNKIFFVDSTTFQIETTLTNRELKSSYSYSHKTIYRKNS